MALALNVEKLIIRGDSKIVFGHVTGYFKAKEDNMKRYSTIVKGLTKEFTVSCSRKSTKRIIEKKMSYQSDCRRIDLGNIVGIFSAKKALKRKYSQLRLRATG